MAVAAPTRFFRGPGQGQRPFGLLTPRPGRSGWHARAATRGLGLAVGVSKKKKNRKKKKATVCSFAPFRRPEEGSKARTDKNAKNAHLALAVAIHLTSPA